MWAWHMAHAISDVSYIYDYIHVELHTTSVEVVLGF